MKITLTTSAWTSHCNMLFSAVLYYAHHKRQLIAVKCIPQAQIPTNAFILEANGKRAFLVYNDGYELNPLGLKMDMYGKRSVTIDDATRGIFPLGFHFNYTYGLHRLLLSIGFLKKKNKVEIIRSVDLFRFTNMSHFDMRVTQLFTPPSDNGGRVIFYTRLWDPARNADPEEKERRHRMNDVRIQVVRTLRKMGNSSSGIFPDAFARRICPDLLVSEKETNKTN